MNRTSSISLALLVLSAVASADSLFRQEEKSVTLIAKDERVKVGDVITVLVKETIDSSVNSDTNTKKESDVNSQAPLSGNQFLTANEPGGLNIVAPQQLPNWEIQMKNEMKTRGQTRRATELNTSMSCLVMRVLGNGLLEIEGDKNVSVNREDSRLHISGIIRARDVTPGNTINSNQIANAKIELKGRGPLWNNQRRGLITRMLDWVSPF